VQSSRANQIGPIKNRAVQEAKIDGAQAVVIGFDQAQAQSSISLIEQALSPEPGLSQLRPDGPLNCC
jgi:hypothetical protein